MKIKRTDPIRALATIYKRGKGGSILYWRAEYLGDRRRSASGVLHGKEKMSAWTTCLPTNTGKANARTGAEQAKEESEAARELKIKNGGYHVSIEDIDQQGKFVPMKAHTYTFGKKLKYPQRGQPKLNGYRMYATKEGLFTYGGTKIVTCPHIWNEVRPVFAEYPNARIDGEAYNHSHRELLNRIGHIVRTTVKVTPELLVEAEEVVQFHVFDGFENEKMKQSSFSVREAWVVKVPKFGNYLRWVGGTTISEEKQIKPWFEKLIAQGYEGGILRDLHNGEYEEGRSQFTLKVKPREDDEFRIVRGADGEGKNKGHLSSLTCVTKRGVEFGVNIRWSFPAKKELFERLDELIGTDGTVSYAYLTEFGKPFHAYIEKVNIPLKAAL